MTRQFQRARLPREVICLSTYAQLNQYLQKFSTGELGLVLLVGRHGTGKSECVRRALSVPASIEAAADSDSVLYVEGHMQPYGLYCELWNYCDRPVVLDDLDRLYADADCVRLLKPLCDTVRHKRLQWLTNHTLNDSDIPSAFLTTSNVILIANEWRSLNPNVRALEDRAITLHFDPTNREVHRQVGQWFSDLEVYDYLESVMGAVPALSMRHYVKGSQLRRAGMADWKMSLLQMVVPDHNHACMVAVQNNPELQSEEERVALYLEMTKCHRATYFRRKARYKMPR